MDCVFPVHLAKLSSKLNPSVPVVLNPKLISNPCYKINCILSQNRSSYPLFFALNLNSAYPWFIPYQSPIGLGRSWIFLNASHPCEPNHNINPTTGFTYISAIPSNNSPNIELCSPIRVSSLLNSVCLLDSAIIWLFSPLKPWVRDKLQP